MANINELRDTLESAQSNLESASWDADQAADNARDAVRNADEALTNVSSAIEQLDDIIGYSKHDVDSAIRHLKYIDKVRALYLDRLENLIDGNQVESRYKYGNLVSFIEMLFGSENGQLVWDEAYDLESFYDNNQFGYKTVKKEVSNG
jgi:ABC-type transporter Mla subunit MlaD